MAKFSPLVIVFEDFIFFTVAPKIESSALSAKLLLSFVISKEVYRNVIHGSRRNLSRRLFV